MRPPTIGRQLTGLLVAASAVTGVAAQTSSTCQSSGLDFTNGGSYTIDSTSSAKFSFTSVFQGCTTEKIEPFLISPTGDEYACSAISTTPAGREQKSECGIPFNQMVSGRWTIVLQGDRIATQRVITITAQKPPETSTVTFTPTVVIGVTSTPAAVTVTSAITQTASLVLVASSTTLVCTDKKTVTVFTTDKPITVLTTAVRTSTSGQTTVVSTTTRVATAQCHGTTQAPAQQPQQDAPFTIPPWVTAGGGPPWARGGRGGRGGPPGRGGRGGGRGRGRGRRVVKRRGSVQERAAAAAMVEAGEAEWEAEQAEITERGLKVVPREELPVVVKRADPAAATLTVTAKTTVTSVVTSIATPVTKTEFEYKQTTVMVTPSVVTFCEGGNGPVTVTAKATNKPVTQSSVVYVTTTVMATVSRATTVASTSYDAAKATQCWASGGWYGA